MLASHFEQLGSADISHPSPNLSDGVSKVWLCHSPCWEGWRVPRSLICWFLGLVVEEVAWLRKDPAQPRNVTGTHEDGARVPGLMALLIVPICVSSSTGHLWNASLSPASRMRWHNSWMPLHSNCPWVVPVSVCLSLSLPFCSTGTEWSVLMAFPLQCMNLEIECAFYNAVININRVWANCQYLTIDCKSCRDTAAQNKHIGHWLFKQPPQCLQTRLPGALSPVRLTLFHWRLDLLGGRGAPNPPRY